MKLYRREHDGNGTCRVIELDPAADIDFSKPTVLVLPGYDVYHADTPKNGDLDYGQRAISGMLKLAETMLGGDVSDQVQIISATWENNGAENGDCGAEHRKNPLEYVSNDARALYDTVISKFRGTQLLTILGSSYGNLIGQEIANLGRMRGETLDGIYMLGLNSVESRDVIAGYGLPGISMIGYNDKKLTEHGVEDMVPAKADEAMKIFRVADDKAIVRAVIPNHVFRWRPSLERSMDWNRHRVGSYADPFPGSYYDDGETKVPAHIHGWVAKRALNNLVKRQGPLTVECMLEDSIRVGDRGEYDADKPLATRNLEVTDHIQRAIIGMSYPDGVPPSRGKGR